MNSTVLPGTQDTLVQELLSRKITHPGPVRAAIMAIAESTGHTPHVVLVTTRELLRGNNDVPKSAIELLDKIELDS